MEKVRFIITMSVVNMCIQASISNEKSKYDCQHGKKDSKLMFGIISLETIPRVSNLLPTAFKLGKNV